MALTVDYSSDCGPQCFMVVALVAQSARALHVHGHRAAWHTALQLKTFALPPGWRGTRKAVVMVHGDVDRRD